MCSTCNNTPRDAAELLRRTTSLTEGLNQVAAAMQRAAASADTPATWQEGDWSFELRIDEIPHRLRLLVWAPSKEQAQAVNHALRVPDTARPNLISLVVRRLAN